MPHDPNLLATDQSPSFVFDYRPLDGGAYDLDDDQRLNNYWDLEPLMRGPQPAPDWLVTDRAAIDTDLGILKTGKEGDVFLVERAVPDGPSTTVAAKRYRSPDHRSFHRSAAYTEGRSVRRSRDQRALKKQSTYGRQVAAGEWAVSEWSALNRCYLGGVPVPYPIQIDGTEILMEWITDPEDGGTAPRLAQLRPRPELLASYFEQVRDAMAALAGLGIAHGDLSAYNILAAGDRLVLIDLPQVVDLAGNIAGPDFLIRDVHNVCAWFASRGLPLDEQAEHDLFADLLAAAFG